MNKEINPLIYFDHAATTPVNPDIITIYNNALKEDFANPSSIHHLGRELERKITLTKRELVNLLHLPNHRVIATSGATEANNLAIIGYALRYQKRGKHLITTVSEHPSVLNAFKYLEKECGFEVTYLSINKEGCILIEDVIAAIKKDTILVSIMAVNNETGAINPIEQIASLLKKYPNIAFHVDAVQAIGKVDLSFKDTDLLTITGHKIHGLKGSGLLFVSNKIELKPLFYGGGQQNNFRSGTEDYPHLIAIKEALLLAVSNFNENKQKVSLLYETFKDYIINNPNLYQINSFCQSNPYIFNFSTINKKASVVVEALSNNNIMVSSLSACSSSHEQESYVIKNMTKDSKLAHNTIRVSFSIYNTKEEVMQLIHTLDQIIKEIR